MEKNHLDHQDDFCMFKNKFGTIKKSPYEQVQGPNIQGSTVPCKIDSNLTDQHFVMHKPFCSIF